jgi:hypothetical protein
MGDYNKTTKDINKKLKEERKSWEETRRKGYLRYVIKTGISVWGVVGTLVFSAVMLYLGQFNVPRPGDLFIRYAIIFMLGGVLYSSLVWFINNKKYKS